MKIPKWRGWFRPSLPSEKGPAIPVVRDPTPEEIADYVESYRLREMENHAYLWEQRIKNAFHESYRLARDSEKIQAEIDFALDMARAEADGRAYERTIFEVA